MALTAVSALTRPLDLLAARAERDLLEGAHEPQQPILLVAGPPRSGTTVVSQSLIQALSVGHLNNLTQLFPHSPITANRRLGSYLRTPARELTSYYGRTSGLAGANDGLHIWDRWWPDDRYAVPVWFEDQQAVQMRKFFAALENFTGKPTLNKNNALATCAEAVCAALPTAHFVYVMRKPSFNVQSILKAREDIQGTRAAAYGVPAPPSYQTNDPIEEVCAQVVYHSECARRQQDKLGEKRFRICAYEEFCADPATPIREIARDVLAADVQEPGLRATVQGLHNSDQVRLPAAEFTRIEETVQRYQAQARR